MKFRHVLLALCMSLLCIFPIFSGCKTEYTNELIYTLREDGESYSVTAEKNCGGDLVIPDSYNGLPIKEIGYHAFWMAELTSVVIPDTVEIIDNAAFANNQRLTSITIPTNLKRINESAFEGCTNLTQITLPEGLQALESWVFENTALLSLHIPSTVVEIETCIATSCDQLESITVAEGNSYYYAKDNCLMERESLYLIAGCKASKIPSETLHIGEHAFSNISSLEKVDFPAGLQSIGPYAFSHCINATFNDLPDSLTYLGEGALYWCSKLENITIPSGITSIPSSCFWGSGLKEITIHENIRSIGRCAFAYCYNLEEFVVSPNNPIYQSIDGNLYSLTNSDDYYSFTLVNYALGKTDTTFTIPDRVTSINERAFAGETDLLDITVGLNVDYIASLAFSCENLKKLTFLNPYGWECSGDDDFTLSNPKKNAKYFTATYASSNWYRYAEN